MTCGNTLTNIIILLPVAKTLSRVFHQYEESSMLSHITHPHASHYGHIHEFLRHSQQNCALSQLNTNQSWRFWACTQCPKRKYVILVFADALFKSNQQLFATVSVVLSQIIKPTLSFTCAALVNILCWLRYALLEFLFKLIMLMHDTTLRPPKA